MTIRDMGGGRWSAVETTVAGDVVELEFDDLNLYFRDGDVWRRASGAMEKMADRPPADRAKIGALLVELLLLR